MKVFVSQSGLELSQLGEKFWARKISGTTINIEIEISENQIVEQGEGINSIRIDPNIK
ncbi:hypothetical protein M2277_005052 [Paenibacillus sp. LBL]|uniref:hypothetical protein n=1 Tax=Paenibacillus sp. LBL TaxID=2940563 RepID=UPI002475D2BF|nr:hypothetical protein [Paenibacillus sp. LBL]MDH6674360.1 hypothetical protein [Paenibacillus sp. LBL]